MNKLPPEARRLLESARERHIPSAREREDIRTALLSTLGTGAFADLPDATAGFEPSASTDVSAELAVGSRSASMTSSAGAGSASAGAGLVATVARSTLLTWRVGKLVLVSAAASTALVLSVATPRTPSSPAEAAARAPAAAPRAPAPAREARPQEHDQLAAAEPSTDSASASGRDLAGGPASVAADESGPARLEPALRVARSSATRTHTAARSTAAPGARRAATAAHATERAESAAPELSAVASAGTAPPESAAKSAHEASADEASAERPAPPHQARATSASAGTDVEEIALLRRAIASLRDNMTGAALAQLEDHARRYPNSVLAHERSGLQIVALCEAGRVADGVRRQPAFFARAGSSPLAVRVRRACTRSER